MGVDLNIKGKIPDVEILNNKVTMGTYASLDQLGLKDSQFVGLTQTQAFDLLVSKIGAYKILYLRMDNSMLNFRNAIISVSYGNLLRVEVFQALRYVATILGSDNAVNLIQCNGYLGFCSGWKPISTNLMDKAQIESLWGGSVTLSGTAQELTLRKSIATAKKVRFTFNDGSPITSVHVEPINAETTLRIGRNKYHIPVQTGSTIGHIVVSFPNETTCTVTGSSSWALRHISGVF